jgi:hypothetical protein
VCVCDATYRNWRPIFIEFIFYTCVDLHWREGLIERFCEVAVRCTQQQSVTTVGNNRTSVRFIICTPLQ